MSLFLFGSNACYCKFCDTLRHYYSKPAVILPGASLNLKSAVIQLGGEKRGFENLEA